MTFRVLLLAALGLTPGCSTFRSMGVGVTTPREVEELLPRAESRLAAGDNEHALEDLRKVREAEHLSNEEQSRIDVLLERCAEARINELSAPGSDPEALEELFDLNLPRQIAITAGVRAARLWLDQDEPVDAYEMIQKVDRRYPPAGTHHERQLAGDVLFEAGMKLAKSKFSILGLFSDRDDAQAILEYLVQNYPQERRCDQAYRQLARLYEHDRLWATAIERHQDLVTYHLDSPLASESEWRIPHLRLVALRRPDYDRRELLRALAELDAWLEVHAGTELEPRVVADRTDCLKRLAQSDLIVSHFYAHVEKWEGARIHAERAVAVAERSGDAKTIAEARAALALVPAAPAEKTGLGTATPATGGPR
ncbi:MAG TPA: hypothetical protein VM509_01925 [Planctomycetota bacterium]|nr:hypothetical protein [Planctomycetota bacterium]